MYFSFPVFKQKNYIFKSFSYFLRLLRDSSKILVFNDGQITEGGN